MPGRVAFEDSTEREPTRRGMDFFSFSELLTGFGCICQFLEEIWCVLQSGVFYQLAKFQMSGLKCKLKCSGSALISTNHTANVACLKNETMNLMNFDTLLRKWIWIKVAKSTLKFLEGQYLRNHQVLWSPLKRWRDSQGIKSINKISIYWEWTLPTADGILFNLHFMNRFLFWKQHCRISERSMSAAWSRCLSCWLWDRRPWRCPWPRPGVCQS